MTTTAAPATRLTEQQREQFEREGFLCPIRVLEDREAKRYLSCYMDYVARNRERLATMKPNQMYQVFSETHFVLPWVYEIVTHPRILNIMESLLGPNLLTWNTNWFSKMPGEKTFVGMHQDGTYWNLRPPTVVTAWVALTPSVATNGCMRVIRGTQTDPMLAQRETYNPDNALSRGQEIVVAVDESQAVNLELQPGEMSLHHIWIVHGSNANTSKDTPRIGIAIRFTRPEVIQESPTKPLALLVRGKDTHGNFEIQPRPTSDIAATQLSAHKEIVDRIRASLMQNAQKKPA